MTGRHRAPEPRGRHRATEVRPSRWWLAVVVAGLAVLPVALHPGAVQAEPAPPVPAAYPTLVPAEPPTYNLAPTVADTEAAPPPAAYTQPRPARIRLLANAPAPAQPKPAKGKHRSYDRDHDGDSR